MSGVAVIRYLLANAAGVVAIAPASRIIAGPILPLNVGLPCLSVAQVSGLPARSLAMSESGRLQVERVQVTGYAGTYPVQKSLLAAVLAACPNQRGTVNGVALESILPDATSPDFFEADPAIYWQSRDFLVSWHV